MKSCPHCEASLEEDAVRCVRCGKWVVTERVLNRRKRKGPGDRKHLILLGALVVFAWALWRLPEATINPRELLDLKPTLEQSLRTMESDLRAFKNLQVEYFRKNGSYAGSPSALGFEASEDITLALILTPTGWSAAATHADFPPDVGCAVFGGSARPPRSPISPQVPDVVECTAR